MLSLLCCLQLALARGQLALQFDDSRVLVGKSGDSALLLGIEGVDFGPGPPPLAPDLEQHRRAALLSRHCIGGLDDREDVLIDLHVEIVTHRQRLVPVAYPLFHEGAHGIADDGEANVQDPLDSKENMTIRELCKDKELEAYLAC